MARPVGSKDSTPRKRRTQSQIAQTIKQQLAPLPEGVPEPLQVLIEAYCEEPPKLPENATAEQILEYAKACVAWRRQVIVAATNAAPYRHARLSSTDGEGGGEAEDWEAAAMDRLKKIDGGRKD